MTGCSGSRARHVLYKASMLGVLPERLMGLSSSWGYIRDQLLFVCYVDGQVTDKVRQETPWTVMFADDDVIIMW